MKQTPAPRLVSDISQALHEKSLVLYELSARLGQVKAFRTRRAAGAFSAVFRLRVFRGLLFRRAEPETRASTTCRSGQGRGLRGLEESRVSSWIFRNKKPSVVPSEFLFPDAAKGPRRASWPFPCCPWTSPSA